MQDTILNEKDIDLGEVTGGSLNPAWDYKKDKEIFGIYQGMQTKVGPNLSNMYNILTKKGVIGIWGTTMLDARFINIPIGNYVKLVYLGKATNPKTKRQYHNFQIYTGAPKK